MGQSGPPGSEVVSVPEGPSKKPTVVATNQKGWKNVKWRMLKMERRREKERGRERERER